MKNKRSKIANLLKIGVLLLGVSLLLWNCEKQDEILNSPQSQFLIAHKNFSSVINNSNLVKKLEELSNYKTKSKNLFKEKVIATNDFTIFTERVTYTKSTYSSRESYTFYIERNGYKESNSVDNLILSKKVNEEDFKASIITYYFPNGIINNSNEVFEIVKYEQVDAKTVSTALAKGCVNTYEYVVEEIEHDCYTGEHSGVSEEGDCNYATNGGTAPYSTWSIHVSVTYQCDGGDTGGLSGPGGLTEGGGATGNSTTGDNPDATIDTGITLPSNCQTDNCTGEITANTINELLDYKLTDQEILWLFYNETEADYLKSFLLENSSLEAITFVKQAIEILSDPILPPNNPIVGYTEKIQKMIIHLRQFGNPEDEFFAEYLESLIPEFTNMTVGDVYDIYKMTKRQVDNLTIKYLEAVVVPFAEAAYPFVVYALTEATLGAALPILARIPKLPVFNSAWVNNLVRQVGVLGIRGEKTYIRVVTTNGNAYSKALELFKGITRNAQSVTIQSNGVRVALFNNGNKIVFRSQSSSGFPATIELTFPHIWSKTRIIKFQ